MGSQVKAGIPLAGDGNNLEDLHMSIFNLHSAVLADYRDFVRSFIVIADERARAFVEAAFSLSWTAWCGSLLRPTEWRRWSCIP